MHQGGVYQDRVQEARDRQCAVRCAECIEAETDRSQASIRYRGLRLRLCPGYESLRHAGWRAHVLGRGRGLSPPGDTLGTDRENGERQRNAPQANDGDDDQ